VIVRSAPPKKPATEILELNKTVKCNQSGSFWFLSTQRDLNGVRVTDVQSLGRNRDMGAIHGTEGGIQGTRLVVFSF